MGSNRRDSSQWLRAAVLFALVGMLVLLLCIQSTQATKSRGKANSAVDRQVPRRGNLNDGNKSITVSQREGEEGSRTLPKDSIASYCDGCDYFDPRCNRIRKCVANGCCSSTV